MRPVVQQGNHIPRMPLLEFSDKTIKLSFWIAQQVNPHLTSAHPGVTQTRLTTVARRIKCVWLKRIVITETVLRSQGNGDEDRPLKYIY